MIKDIKKWLKGMTTLSLSDYYREKNVKQVDIAEQIGILQPVVCDEIQTGRRGLDVVLDKNGEYQATIQHKKNGHDYITFKLSED